MKLWYSPASPFARKVRVCALELGLAGRIEAAVVTVQPSKPNLELARHNPLIKIPALKTDGGSVLYDSRVICEFLDALAGGGKLFPASGAARWDALRRQALGDGVMDAGILRRYELAQRPEALHWADWLAGQQAKVEHGLDAAEGEAGGWREGFDIGHITLACALGWLDFRFPDSAWRAPRPQLAAWFTRVSARRSLAQTLPHA
ncbi:MAG TPA: glutathione S-transferase [Burkholderiales bacterium]|nr:glutathione S-transferase [Burkholderiales bacterium]